MNKRLHSLTNCFWQLQLHFLCLGFWVLGGDWMCSWYSKTVEGCSHLGSETLYLAIARELCYNLLLSLSFSRSWGAAYTYDITSLLSNSPGEAYLSSFHINHMFMQSKTQYEAQLGPNHTSCYIFATFDLIGAIIHFYSAVLIHSHP